MKKIINTPNAPNPVGPYNQSVLVNGLLFISGQIGIDPETGTMKDDTIEEETTRVMDNIGAILKEAGCTFNDIVKCSVFVSDIENYGRINAVYSRYFDENTAPVRELVEVANLPKYVRIEISAIAVKK